VVKRHWIAQTACLPISWVPRSTSRGWPGAILPSRVTGRSLSLYLLAGCLTSLAIPRCKPQRLTPCVPVLASGKTASTIHTGGVWWHPSQEVLAANSRAAVQVDHERRSCSASESKEARGTRDGEVYDTTPRSVFTSPSAAAVHGKWFKTMLSVGRGKSGSNGGRTACADNPDPSQPIREPRCPCGCPRRKNVAAAGGSAAIIPIGSRTRWDANARKPPEWCTGARGSSAADGQGIGARLPKRNYSAIGVRRPWHVLACGLHRRHRHSAV